ncbi:MAG: uracil-DNA glycosylase [Myxococcota bacterium]
MAPAKSSSHHEAGELIASANALLRELVEEGVCEIPKSAASISKAIDAAPKAATPKSPSGLEFVDSGIEIVPWIDRRPQLDEVRKHLGDCQRCGLCEGRQSIVFGDGNPKAKIMFIGEGPGEQEDLSGLPFVGRAGELLTQMIEKGIGLSRSEVYICNIIKCRPPRNRNPRPPEIKACRPFLDGQISAIDPKVIVTLGKPAASLLLDREVAITKIRGTWQDYRGIPLMPTLHPAYVLRRYTTENRRAVWQDLQAAMKRAGA